MSMLSRSSVKILLINDQNQILLICADDPKTTTLDGRNYGRFWFPIGGEIEKGESLEDAALREAYEEAGLEKHDLELGPVVWHGEFDLIVGGTPRHMNERFIVGKALRTDVALTSLTEDEAAVINDLAWFSIDDIRECPDVIFPIVLPDHLPDIINGNYPSSPLKIDLGKQPHDR